MSSPVSSRRPDSARQALDLRRSRTAWRVALVATGVALGVTACSSSGTKTLTDTNSGISSAGDATTIATGAVTTAPVTTAPPTTAPTPNTTKGPYGY